MTRSNVVVQIFQKQKLFVIEVLKKMLLPRDWLLLMQFEMDLLLTGVQMSQKKDRRNNLLLDCMVGKQYDEHLQRIVQKWFIEGK